MKSLTYGDTDHPKDRPGCHLFLPKEPSKSGKAFWDGYKSRLQEKTQPMEATPKPAELGPDNPVTLLLQKILESTQQGKTGQLLTLECICM